MSVYDTFECEGGCPMTTIEKLMCHDHHFNLWQFQCNLISYHSIFVLVTICGNILGLHLYVSVHKHTLDIFVQWARVNMVPKSNLAVMQLPLVVKIFEDSNLTPNGDNNY